jgi:hypothetical protein
MTDTEKALARARAYLSGTKGRRQPAGSGRPCAIGEIAVASGLGTTVVRKVRDGGEIKVSTLIAIERVIPEDFKWTED